MDEATIPHLEPERERVVYRVLLPDGVVVDVSDYRPEWARDAAIRANPAALECFEAADSFAVKAQRNYWTSRAIVREVIARDGI